MKDLNKQFAGNYVRLVNQCRDLQAELTIKERMITLLAITNKRDTQKGNGLITDIIEYYKQQAISELVSEQNKKAADNASI